MLRAGPFDAVPTLLGQRARSTIPPVVWGYRHRGRSRLNTIIPLRYNQ